MHGENKSFLLKCIPSVDKSIRKCKKYFVDPVIDSEYSEYHK